MRLALLLIAMLIVSGCATTTPQKVTLSRAVLSERWEEYAKSSIDQKEKNSDGSKTKLDKDDLGFDFFGILNGLTTGAVIGASLGYAEKPNFTGSLGRSILGKPARVYKKIPTTSICDYARIIIDGNGFEMSLIDKESGFLLGVFNKGIVRSFLFWKWEQKQYVTFLFLPVIGGENQTRFYYLSWVEEKPPLSSDFVEVESSDESQNLINSMISDLDKTVVNEGGEI